MRLIDADVLIEFVEGRYTVTWNHDYDGGIKDACIDILNFIDNAPTIDAVPVVRCKDCRHWCEMQNLTGACLRLCAIDGALWMGTDAIDYCSYGEGKDDDAR